MEKYKMIATSTFGLEASVKREVIKIGGADVKVSDGRIDFTGDEKMLAKANIWLRCADRVLLNVSEFEATSFDELFDNVKKINWGDIIPKDGRILVVGKSVKSELFSISDCQAITKKAIVEKMKEKYKIDWFEEDGAEYKIQVGILKNHVTITLDTTGAGLHKRGYRSESVIAPIKETLAAAMIELSYWRKDRVLLDPMCGSGTIPIEAAMMARNIAPGLYRDFSAQQWGFTNKKIWNEVREEAKNAIDEDVEPIIYASDMNKVAVAHAKQNAINADVKRFIKFETIPFSEVKLPTEYGIIITNPPYGERLGEKVEVANLYKEMGELLSKNNKWSKYIITSNEEFEKWFGKKADAKRKLFNGMLKTDYYQYNGERPPREELK